MQKLNIYLIKSTVTDFLDIIELDYQNDVKKVEIKDSEASFFLIKDPKENKPDWFNYFSGTDVERFLKASMTNPSAVLVVKFDGHYFALTFGHGRFMVNPYSTVPDFGLKVCLNVLSGDKIKTVDSRTLEQLGLHTRQQAITPMDFNNFTIDVEKDLIKSVDGHIDQGNIGTYFKGSTCLTIVTGKEISKLSELCAELITIYRKKTYEQEFGWVDNIKYISDLAKINDLNDQLLQKIVKQEFNDMFLGAPEITDDSDIKFYKFTGLRSSDVYSVFPSINEFERLISKKIAGINNRDKKANRKIESTDLFNCTVTAFDRNQKPSQLHSWRIFNCLHAEVIKSQKTYKLLDGNWYEIDDDYLKKIEAQVSMIPTSSLKIPHMNLKEDEEVYNVRAAKKLSALCMDQNFVQLAGRSKFEFCDIFTKDKQLIHVKKHLGASAISHLLYQGFVSAQLFSQNSDVRKELAGKKTIKGTVYEPKVNPNPFNSQNYEIVFVIASARTKPLKTLLSFFSKISLAHKFKVLSAMGYKVSCKTIEIK